MTKIIYITVLLLCFLKVQAQDDSVRLFYADKIVTGEHDSARLAQCRDTQYNGAKVKVILFKNNVKIDSLSKLITDYVRLEDSVMFEIAISRPLYDSSDSVVIIPTHRFSCKGARGGSVTTAGEEKKIKNLKLKFISNPAGAVVYLIPKIIWERNALIRAKNEDALSHYRIASGITPVWSPVQEYVYMSLFKNDSLYRSIECSPTNKNPVDSVYADFINK